MRVIDAMNHTSVRRCVALGLALVVGVVLAYLPAIGAGFIWDDDLYLWANPFIERGLDGLRAIWIPRNTPQYYPVVFTSFWIEWRLWGDDPTGYHIVNVMLHTSTALLLWRVLVRLGVSVVVGWAIAFWFALHPVQVESVAWITERKNVLSSVFYFLALLAYLRFDACRHVHRVEASNKRPQDSRWAWYVAGLLLFVLALLSKSVTASLPVAIALGIFYREGPISWRRLLPLVPMLVLGATAGIHTGLLERYHVGAVGPMWEHAWIEKIVIASNAMGFYMWKTVAPWPLMFIYPRWAIDPTDIAWWCALIALLVVCALCCWMWIRRSWRGPIVAFTFFGVTIFPALGFANIYPHRFAFVADHFQYLAVIGSIALLVMLLHVLVRQRRRVFVSIISLVALVLGTLTYLQSRMYEDERSLYLATVAKNPDAWMAHANLSRIVLLDAQRALDEGQALQARRHATIALEHAMRALDVRPGHDTALANASEALRLLDRLDEARVMALRAIDVVEEELSWRDERGYDTLANRSRAKLAHNLMLLARVEELTGNSEDAIEAYERAAALAGESGEASALPIRHNALARLAQIAIDENRPYDSAAYLKRLAETSELRYQQLLFLADAARRAGSYREAIMYLERARERMTNGSQQDGPILYRLVWIRSTAREPAVRDGRWAVRMGRQLVEATGGTHVEILDAYAAALAEVDQYDEAVRFASRAVELAREREQHALAEAIEMRRNLYEQHRPYRE